MDDILLKNIAHLATFDDDDDRELQDVDLLIHKGTIKSIGIDIAVEADTDVIDAAHLIVLPGLINGHQHLYQVGLRAFPELERAGYVGVGLHTHLYQNVDTRFCFDTYGMSPWQMLGERGWHKPGVWLAHVVDAPAHEISAFAAAGVGIVHVVAPDLRMGWGLAPIRSYLDAGCTVGFGTTGSASNDGCNQLADLRLAALAHRMTASIPEHWLSIRELLGLSTRGSADCLSRSRLGRVAPGMAADLACWNLRSVDRVGVHDPLIGLILTGLSDRCDVVIAGGKIVVRDGHCVTINEQELADRAAAAIPI